MNELEIGKLLLSKREELGLKSNDIARKIGCSRTTVERWENGRTTIPRTKISRIAGVYEIDLHELEFLLGFRTDEPSKNSLHDFSYSKTTVTVEDLEFLISVTKGLTTPMNISVICELLKCRKQQC